MIPINVGGLRRLHLLDRQLGKAYTVEAGMNYRQVLLDVFADAGLSGVQVEESSAHEAAK